MRNLVTITDWVDQEHGICQTRLIGAGKDMPVHLVQSLLIWELMKEMGYRSEATIPGEGWEFEPSGPVWHSGEGDTTIDPCWTLDWNRETD